MQPLAALCRVIGAVTGFLMLPSQCYWPWGGDGGCRNQGQLWQGVRGVKSMQDL